MFDSNYNSHRERSGWWAKTSAEDDLFFYKMATWTEQFAWWPHRCDVTGRIIWLQLAYRGCVRWSENWITTEYRWHDLHEHLIWVLKGPYG